jgi:hypothetical protein
MIKERICQTERLYNSILIIDRVANAKQQPADPDTCFVDHVNALRSLASSLTQDLAEKGSLSEDNLSDLKSKILQTQETASKEADDQFASVCNMTLVFAFGEIALSLENLKNAFDESYQGSVLDWSSQIDVMNMRFPQSGKP